MEHSTAEFRHILMRNDHTLHVLERFDFLCPLIAPIF